MTVQMRLFASLHAKFSKDSEVAYLVSGMGLDGHIASIFPKENENITSQDKKSYFSWVKKKAKTSTRVSLHWPILQKVNKLAVMIHGKEKLEALKAWYERNDETRPIIRLLNSRPVSVLWSP